MARLNITAAVLLVLAWVLVPGSAQAETYHTCAGFITSLPAVISTQGTWCMKQDLATAVTSGNAITINTNNVTIDCNDFKLGGLAAGVGTSALGISAIGRSNVTVRHCNVRGFYVGIYLEDIAGGGHAVEDNRLDGNTFNGVLVEGDGSVVRRNRVSDTGGSTVTASPYGIATTGSVDVIDNTVSGMTSTAGSNANVFGIHTDFNVDAEVTGNRVRGLVPDGTGASFGIFNLNSERITMRSNDVHGNGALGSVGFRCTTGTIGNALDNVINRFETGMTNCVDAGGNVVNP